MHFLNCMYPILGTWSGRFSVHTWELDRYQYYLLLLSSGLKLVFPPRIHSLSNWNRDIDAIYRPSGEAQLYTVATMRDRLRFHCHTKKMVKQASVIVNKWMSRRHDVQPSTIIITCRQSITYVILLVEIRRRENGIKKVRNRQQKSHTIGNRDVS